MYSWLIFLEDSSSIVRVFAFSLLSWNYYLSCLIELFYELSYINKIFIFTNKEIFVFYSFYSSV